MTDIQDTTTPTDQGLAGGTARLNEAEKAVLNLLGPSGDDVEWSAYPFRPIIAHTGLDRAVVRRACRSLARKGLTAFERALWTEDGEMIGAGYRATLSGKHRYYNDTSVQTAREVSQ